ncbi:hypothetical protein, partial [uncultured Agathobaculum sp.]|uniref:hypothetical protein n=1 Tax=uncultured Agathobaculum sp. TaxID=2048140 RepID=UPI0032095DE0
PTLKRTLNLGIEKGRLLKNSRPKGGLIQVVCYPTSPETVDITGFFEKFCIAIRTTFLVGTSDFFGNRLFFYFQRESTNLDPKTGCQPANVLPGIVNFFRLCYNFLQI